jgi:cytochrome c
MPRDLYAVLLLAAAGSVLSTATMAEAPAAAGSALFTAHSCINCHGADGKAPVSKLVPTLAGEPADELYENAMTILNGKGASAESALMHAAIYSTSNCAAPPSADEVKTIAEWLATR